MEGIRQKIKRTGNKLIIDLPDDFKAEVFELILFPADDVTEKNEDHLNEWRNFSVRTLEGYFRKDEPDYSDVLIKEPNKKYNP